MAVLKKEQVVNLLTKSSQPGAFILCKYLEHNGALNLCCNTETAPVTDFKNGRFIGRVPSRIFDWFTWEVLDRPALNLIRYKYAGNALPAAQKKAFEDLPILVVYPSWRGNGKNEMFPTWQGESGASYKFETVCGLIVRGLIQYLPNGINGNGHPAFVAKKEDHNQPAYNRYNIEFCGGPAAYNDFKNGI